MSYRIAQDFEYIDKDYWRWWAWIDAEDAELDNVQQVAWLLHPSFKDTRVVVKDRSTRFQLDSGGWGIFLLRAELTLRHGKSQRIQHHLKLEYPDDTDRAVPEKAERAGSPAKLLRVFLSYGQQEARLATKLREELASEGIEVWDQSRIEPDAPWNESVKRMISVSDAVVGLVGKEDASPFVVSELKFAAASAKPSFVLLPKGVAGADVSGKARQVHFESDGPHASILADLLRKQKALD